MTIDFSPVNFSDRHLASLSSGQDASADPFAGQIAANGKPIWTQQQAADNLSRPDVDWTFGNNGAGDDKIITFGFWQTLEEVQASYYTEEDANGILLTADGDQIVAGNFAAFTAEQQAMAILNLQLWDDLIDISFQQVSSASDADITFGFVEMSPAAGAHAYYPQEQALNEFYGYVNAGKVAGDVWANYLYSGAVDGNPNIFEDTSIGNYAWQAITHEIGHSLGLAHAGDYNASDDNDGDGQPDPITYEGDAYFYQDSNQYTIMSYFDGSVTGQAAVVWAGANSYFVYAQTPQVHDILSVQQIYGADMTTRAGDTVYGFNSTADRGVFDFTTNIAPIVTIWDGGGNDTLDLSGFDANNIIDINEGAFSSAGYKIDAASLAAFGITTAAQLAAFAANNGLGPDGRPVDNIAIAYGAHIENAVGGSGNDLLISNELNNLLNGGGGSDTVGYDRATAAVQVDISLQTATGGGGSDTLMSIENAIGSRFADTLLGDANANTLDGNLGTDTLNGGGGSDTASYASATAGVTVSLAIAGAQATGGAGSDTLISMENLSGSRFNDLLTGDANANVISGDAGNDTLIGGLGNDTLNGGAGTDTADYSATGGPVNVDLGTGTATGPDGSDTLSSIERVLGSAFGDTITGNAGANILLGLGGNDVIKGGNGLDVITFGAGNDTFMAEVGAAKVALKSGNMSVDIITDFTHGSDHIDLGDLGSFTFGGNSKDKTADQVWQKSFGSISAAEKALGFDIDGQAGASGVSGPVTIVYVDVDGGAVDSAIILLNTNSVNASDFILA